MLDIGPVWSMNGGGAGADMGNEPAGHRHWQLQPPFDAAWALALPFAPPPPATTVTWEPAADVVLAPMSASWVRVAELMDAALDDEDSAAAVAAEPLPPPPPPPPAITVTALA